jgi:hypothetical protein
VYAAGLFVGTPVFDPATQKIVSYKVWENWNNSGTTPAIGVEAWLNFKSDSAEVLPKNFPYPYDPKIPKMVYDIGAHGVVPSNPFRIPIQTIQDLQRRRTRLYIWGEVTYYDIFSKTLLHKTQFCNEIANVNSTSLDLTSPGTHVDLDNFACAEHNCHDETCKQ